MYREGDGFNVTTYDNMLQHVRTQNLGEHKPGRIKPGRIKRAALSLQNQH